MGFLNKIFNREKRIATSDPFLAEFFGYNSAGSGALVNPDQASGHAVAHRCIQLHAENLAAVPLWLHRRTANGGRDIAADHPLAGVLHDKPNEFMTAYEAREFLVTSLLVHGNAFARLEINARGQVTALHPVSFHKVSVERLESGRLRYKIHKPGGGTERLLQEEMLHLRYRLGPDLVMGLSPLQINRETVGLAIDQNATAASAARKSFRPAGALVFPNQLSKENLAKAKTDFAQRFSGTANAGEIMVMDAGVDWKPISFSSRDAEFLESRKLSNLDICRIYGVPPTVAGITDNATYSNTDQESRALVSRCLAPMARRIEQAMNNALLTPAGRRTLFIEHDLAGLLRGDLTARYAAYKTGRDGGWLSVNEVRAWENLPGIDGGDEYLSPLNMTPAGTREAGAEGGNGSD